MKKKVELTRKLLKTGTSLCVTLPSQLLKLRGWHEGMEVIVAVNEKGDFVIREK